MAALQGRRYKDFIPSFFSMNEFIRKFFKDNSSYLSLSRAIPSLVLGKLPVVRACCSPAAFHDSITHLFSFPIPSLHCDLKF